MNALTKSLARSRAVVQTAHDSAMEMKDAGLLADLAPVGVSLDEFRSRGRNRLRYASYRGWLYSAIHALAQEAAGQAVNAARLTVPESEPGERTGPSAMKSWLLGKMTSIARNKAVMHEMEVVQSGPLLDSLEKPNPFQYRWQFVYTFVANLNLTGWAYIICSSDDDGEAEYYSIPTTWVRPNKTFTEFKIVNPENPAAGDDKMVLTRDNVAWAYLPNPGDPLGALAPTASQMQAVTIDDHIQESQEHFFRNGIFPSAVVSIGKEPHPSVPGGRRPRLSASQRRQIISVIKKTMADVHNYGNPVIVDGLIESITRFSATQNEMGWDKSETKIRTRILSAFGVHPFILGEPIGIGGHAQASVIKSIFCDRVNTFLDMIGWVMTELVNVRSDGRMLVWWDKCEAKDPVLFSANMKEGRKNGDVTRDEYRSFMGLPPSEVEVAKRNKLLESVGGMTGTVAILNIMSQGSLSPDAAAYFLSEFLELPIEEVRANIGAGSDRAALESAAGELRNAANVLRLSPAVVAGAIDGASRELVKV